VRKEEESREGGCLSLLAPVADALCLQCCVYSLASLGKCDAASAASEGYVGRLTFSRDI